MPEDINLWSVTALTNGAADNAINAAENNPPSSVNDGMRSIMASVAKWRDDLLFRITSGGSANAQTFSASTAYSATIFNGATFGFRAGFTNSGLATFNVTPNGGGAWGARNIVIPWNGTTASVISGMIQAGGRYFLSYDSAAGVFHLLNPTPGILPTTTITGPLTVSASSTINGNEVVSGTLSVGQTLTVSGNAVVSGTLVVGPALTVTGSELVSGLLTVAQTATFNGSFV